MGEDSETTPVPAQELPILKETILTHDGDSALYGSGSLCLCYGIVEVRVFLANRWAACRGEKRKKEGPQVYKEAAPSSSIAINERTFSSDKAAMEHSRLPKTKDPNNTQQSVADFLGQRENEKETSWNAGK